MKKNILDSNIFQCPYCQTGLVPKKQVADISDLYKFSVWKCDCDEYPLIEGILYLKKDHKTRNRLAVELIERGDPFGALCSLVEGKLARLLATSCMFFPIVKQNLKSLKLETTLRILTLIQPHSRNWFRALIHRAMNNTLINLNKIVAKDGRSMIILELCCGAGHFLNSIANKYDRSWIIGVDTDITSLLLARFYVIDSKIILICSDLNYGVPLKDLCSDFVFMNESFSYIYSKKRLLQELRRVLKRGSRCFITGVHNVGQKIKNGYPISIKVMKEMLKPQKAQFVGESEVNNWIDGNFEKQVKMVDGISSEMSFWCVFTK